MVSLNCKIGDLVRRTVWLKFEKYAFFRLEYIKVERIQVSIKGIGQKLSNLTILFRPKMNTSNLECTWVRIYKKKKDNKKSKKKEKKKKDHIPLMSLTS